MDSDGKAHGNLEFAGFWLGIERPGQYEGMEQADIQRMKRVSKKRGAQITSLISWRYIYPDIQRSGYFGQRLEDTYNAGFKTAIYCLNLDAVVGRNE